MLDPRAKRNSGRWNFFMKTLRLRAIIALALSCAASATALASEDGGANRHEEKPVQQTWSFAGAFGRYDKAQLRRGFKVYKEVCASCHSIKLLAFRNLGEVGGPELASAEVLALAASCRRQAKCTGEIADL